MAILNWPPVITDKNDEYYDTLIQRQANDEKNYDTLRNYNSIPIESTVVVQREDGGL